MLLSPAFATEQFETHPSGGATAIAPPHRGCFLALRRIMFFVWVTFGERKWGILGEHRGENALHGILSHGFRHHPTRSGEQSSLPIRTESLHRFRRGARVPCDLRGNGHILVTAGRGKGSSSAARAPATQQRRAGREDQPKPIRRRRLAACGKNRARSLADARGSVDPTSYRAATVRERVLPQAARKS